MPIFMIVPTDDAEPISKALVSHQAQGTLDFTKLPKNGFFVQYSGTTQELSNLLGITDGSSASAVVAAISSYYGRAPTTLWEWLKTRWSV
jgi:hypothetical protein